MTEPLVTQYQVTYWRELPSMVVARDGEDVAKATLAGRLLAAIDEAAMRLGDTGSEDYLAGWVRGPWTDSEGSPSDVLARVSAELEQEWPARRLTDYLNGLGKAS